MTEIAAASHEQSSGIEQINKAITQMDTVVQMNASLVEEATAAATSMANQATALARSVAQFQVREDVLGAAMEATPVQASRASAAPLPRAADPAPRRVSAPPREPALAGPDAEEWKEF
jgi:hypothetical protein